LVATMPRAARLKKIFLKWQVEQVAFNYLCMASQSCRSI
jgi:hypothetical protein